MFLQVKDEQSPVNTKNDSVDETKAVHVTYFLLTWTLRSLKVDMLHHGGSGAVNGIL